LSVNAIIKDFIKFCVNPKRYRQETQLSLEKADRTAYVRSPASDFQSRTESDLSEVTQFYAHYVNGMLSRKLR